MDDGADVNREVCGGIRQLADSLTSKLHGFVEWGPDSAALTKSLPAHLRALLHSLADQLEMPGERDAVAGIVFDILTTLDTASEDFADVVGHIKKLRDHEKGETMRLPTSIKLAPRDEEIYRLAGAEWRQHPASRKSLKRMAERIVGPINAWLTAKCKESDDSGEPERMTWSAVSKVLSKAPQKWKPYQVSI